MSEYDWFDTLPDAAQQSVKANEEIARYLAEHGPFTDDDGWCAHCFQTYTREPHHHAVDCAWRRAKALYPR